MYNEFKVDKSVCMQWTSVIQRETVLRIFKEQPPLITKLISATDISLIVSRRVLNAARKFGYNKPKSKPNPSIAKRVWQCNQSFSRESPLLLFELK